MDQGVLVRDQIDEGKAFVDRLQAEGFDVKGAFWLYDPEAEKWYLYIETDEVAKTKAADAYKKIERIMYKMQPHWIEPFGVTLTNSSDPRVKAVREFQAKYTAPMATWVRRQYLGDVYFDHAYLYPPLTESRH